MADFRTDTSAIKVDPIKGMSLADMLNIQKSSYELSKLKELYPAMIAGEQARSKKSQIEAGLAEQTAPLELKTKQQSTESSGMDLKTKKQQAIASGYVAKIFDPMVVKAAKNPESVNTDELVKNIAKWGLQQGQEAGVDQETTMNLIKPYLEIAKNNPGQLQDYLKQRHILGLTPESRTGAMTPSGIAVNTGAGGYVSSQNPFSGIPQGQPIPGTEFTQKVSPQRVNVNGVEGTLDANGKFTPLGGSSQNGPTNEPTNIPQNAPTAPPKEKPEIITGETKVLSAGGVPQLNDQQKQAYEAATKEKQSYLDLSRNNQETKKSIDSAYKTINSAVGNKPGQLARTTVKSIFGNTELEILNKSLADVYVRQAAMLGAKTDQGSADIKETQGNPNLTVGGLKSILERAQATTTAWEDYTKANAAYEKNRGIYGANVNHEQFKKAWASNYDTNIFILQNIHDSNLPKAEKELEAQKLFKGMSDAQIKEFERKAKNIYALENGTYK